MNPFLKLAQAYRDSKSKYAPAHFNDHMERMAVAHEEISKEFEAPAQEPPPAKKG